MFYYLKIFTDCFKFIRNLLYRDNFIKKYLKYFFSNNSIYQIKSHLDKQNKITNKNYIIQKNLDFNLPDKYFKWNNDETNKIEQITNLDLSKWYY